MAKSGTSIWDNIMRYARAQSRIGQESHVKVGILGNSAGKAQTDNGISVIELAAIHEFGAPRAHIPERSFIRRAMRNNVAEYRTTAAKFARAFITGRISYETALEGLGAWGVNAIKKEVASGDHIPPPLKPATVRRKGSARPLVDTGQLINAVSWKVWIGRARDAKGRFLTGGPGGGSGFGDRAGFTNRRRDRFGRFTRRK